MSVVAEEEIGSRQGLSRSARNNVNVLSQAKRYSTFMRDFNIAGIAQLGEQQTEVLEVPCSIHGPGKAFFYLPVQIH